MASVTSGSDASKPVKMGVKQRHCMVSRSIRLGLVMMTLALAMPATAQVFKCKSPTGATTFQATPCEGAAIGERLTVRPASGLGDAPAPVSAASGAPIESGGSQMANNAQKYLTQLEGERLKREAFEAVDNKRNQITAHSRLCSARMEATRAQKSQSANTLAGATWEASISQEMQAQAAKCDSESRVLQSDLDELRRSAARL